MPAKSHQEPAQASQLIGVDSFRHGRLPRRRQVEQEHAGLGSPGDSIKAPPQLITMGCEDYGALRLALGQPNRRVGKGANAGRQRQWLAGKVPGQPNAARFQAVGFDPFRWHPRAGVEDFHQLTFARTISNSASTRAVMRAESEGE